MGLDDGTEATRKRIRVRTILMRLAADVPEYSLWFPTQLEAEASISKTNQSRSHELEQTFTYRKVHDFLGIKSFSNSKQKQLDRSHSRKRRPLFIDTGILSSHSHLIDRYYTDIMLGTLSSSHSHHESCGISRRRSTRPTMFKKALKNSCHSMSRCDNKICK